MLLPLGLRDTGHGNILLRDTAYVAYSVLEKRISQSCTIGHIRYKNLISSWSCNPEDEANRAPPPPASLHPGTLWRTSYPLCLEVLSYR